MGDDVVWQGQAGSPGSAGASPYLPGGFRLAFACDANPRPRPRDRHRSVVLDCFPNQQTDRDHEDGQVIPASSPLVVLDVVGRLDDDRTTTTYDDHEDDSTSRIR